MQKVGRTERERELESLLQEITAHPERALIEKRTRVAVLQRMLAARL